MMTQILFGLMIPFLGTTLGAGMVFFMKRDMNILLEKFLLGLAAGVMTAASVWSLLLPALDMSADASLRFLPAAVGLTLGFLVLMAVENAAMKIERLETHFLDGSKKKTALMNFAVTLHNIPEGMAVGVALAACAGAGAITFSSATALSIGIAIQNFPEGAIISMPLKNAGASRRKAFFLGTLSGAVEPVFGCCAVLLTGMIAAALPYFLSFAAGAMLYVVIAELIPESCDAPLSSVTGFLAGFLIMMILDVQFG